MNTDWVFRYQWKFFRFNQRFRGKIKSTMISARKEYVDEWRRTSYYKPPKWVSTRFRDDFRSLKDLIWNQTVYLKWSWCIYNTEANTSELRMAYCVYAFDDNRHLNWVWTCVKWNFSSAMFDLEPVDLFPREEGWTAVPGERYVDSLWFAWRDSDIYIALGWPTLTSRNWIRFKMYWAWKPYRNTYDEWYEYVNWQAVSVGMQRPEEHLQNVMYSNQTVAWVYWQTWATAYISNYTNVWQGPTITANGDGAYTLTYN